MIVDVGAFPLHLQDRVRGVFAAAEQEVPQVVRPMILQDAPLARIEERRDNRRIVERFDLASAALTPHDQ